MDTEIKYTPEMESKYIKIIKKLVTEHPSSYHNFLKRKEYTELVEFIRYKVPLLADSFYTMSTKIHWVLNGITEFPKCHYCGNPLSKINVGAMSGYTTRFCSRKCQGNSQEYKEARKKTLIKRYGSLENFYKEASKQTRCTKIERYGTEKYNNREKCAETNLKRYGNVCPANSEEGKRKSRETKIRKYGHPNYSNWEQAKKTIATYSEEQKHEWVEKARQTSLEKYGVEHYSKTSEFRKLSSRVWKKIWEDDVFKQKMSSISKNNFKKVVEKIIKTNMERYGVEFYFSSKQARTHRRNMTEYDGIIFDSKLEIQFYSWCIENGLKVQVHPELYFVYDDDGVKRKYYPDFIINDTIVVETKGGHFFRTNQAGELEMFLPFKYDFWDDNIYEKHCKTMNNKYKCMLENNVLIITEKDMKFLNKNIFLKRI